MKIAIMQPYFFPYIGYYKLMSEVDVFVIYDDVQYTKKGWINRNYLNSKTGPWLFSIPIEDAASIETISSKRIAAEYNRKKLITRIRQNYAMLADSTKLNKLEEIIKFETSSLFEYVEHSLREFGRELNIDSTKIVISSHLGDFSKIKGEEKVLRICKEVGATQYINPPGGRTLYSEKNFENSGIELRFQNKIPPRLKSQDSEIPYLSILDNYLVCDHVSLDADGE